MENEDSIGNYTWQPMQNLTAVDDYASNELMVGEVMAIVIRVIIVLGFIGNLSVIVVVVADRHLRSSTNALIASLAFVDLLVVVVCLPYTAVAYATDQWPFGDTWCKVSCVSLSLYHRLS